MALKRRGYDRDEEQFMVVNLIKSTPLCREVLHATDETLFKSKGLQVIIKWMYKHYGDYREAIGEKINDYFHEEKDFIDEDVCSQIYNTLEHLSGLPDTDINNVPYLKDRAFTLLRKKFFENKLKKANLQMSEGKFEQAEETIAKRFAYSEIVSKAVRLDDKALLQDAIRLLFRDEDEDPFFKFEGRFGSFIKIIEPGWLVSFIAPPKTGKTIWMVETLITAIMQHKNVVFFSFEMPTTQIVARMLKRITGFVNEEGGTFHVPIFDCVKNQWGDCENEGREGYSDLKVQEEGQPTRVATYEERDDWIPCSVCRGTKDFKPASWKEPVEKDSIDEVQLAKKVSSFMKLYAKHCRIVFHPSKSADSTTLHTELDTLEQRENFIADMIIADYADLMKPEKGSSGQKRLDLDETWEQLRSLGQSRFCTVVTASQTSKAGVGSTFIKNTDIAEDFSKIAKLDLGIGLAQTEEMKKQGILNMNKIAYRHGSFIESYVCTILQDLEAMQGHLDSEF